MIIRLVRLGGLVVIIGLIHLILGLDWGAGHHLGCWPGATRHLWRQITAEPCSASFVVATWIQKVQRSLLVVKIVSQKQYCLIVFIFNTNDFLFYALVEDSILEWWFAFICLYRDYILVELASTLLRWSFSLNPILLSDFLITFLHGWLVSSWRYGVEVSRHIDCLLPRSIKPWVRVLEEGDGRRRHLSRLEHLT